MINMIITPENGIISQSRQVGTNLREAQIHVPRALNINSIFQKFVH